MIGIETENGFQRADGTPVPDAALSTTSTNSVQNKVVKTAIDDAVKVRSVSVTTTSSGVVTVAATQGYSIIGGNCTDGWVLRDCIYNNTYQALIGDSSGTIKTSTDVSIMVLETKATIS